MSRFDWLEVPKQDDKGGAAEREKAGDRAFDEEHYIRLAEEGWSEGRYEKALRYYSRALNLDLRAEKAWLGQLKCLLDLGEYQETVTWADKALEMFPGSPEIVAAKAAAWGRLGEIEKAKGFSDSALKSGQPSGFVWWARGDILIGTNRSNAEFCFRKAMEVEKKDWGLFLRIAKTYLSIAQAAKAREYLLQARNLNQLNPMIWYWLGVAYQRLDMMEKAEEAFAAALEIQPENAEFVDALGRIRNTGTLQRLIRRFKGFLRR